jgi:transposase, IS30 family
VEAFVITWLEEDHSPEQIVGYAQKEEVKCVSIECIYTFIWTDKKAGCRQF